MGKPKTIDEYKKWLKNTLNVEITNRHENHYNSVVSKIKQDLSKHKIWISICEQLKEIDYEYQKNTKYPLVIPNFIPNWEIKPFNSLIEKSFRKNVLLNKNWPQEPNGGWITPDNWFERINDIVRTLFIVKYLDGVKFLAENITNVGKTLEISFKTFYEAREEGYYATHLYATIPIEIPKMNFDTEIANITFEIQITTQLQEIIRKLLHKHYEQNRITLPKANEKWQWDYKSQEFSINYLGHILHYLEGMITEIRDKN